MKNFRPTHALTAGLLFACVGFAIPLGASTPQLYRGTVTFKGEVQNEAKPGSFSFTAEGKLTNAASGDVVTVSFGGLFRSTTSRIVRTTYVGTMTSYVNNRGKIERSKKRVRLKSSGRTVRIPGGTLRFTKAPKANVDPMQRVRGKGTYQVRS